MKRSEERREGKSVDVRGGCVVYKKLPAPVEFIAAVISYYVHPVNIQTACLIMEGAEFTENIINGVERAVKAVFFSSRRRHTRSYGDWSSDVCSSDLVNVPARRRSLSAIR